MSNEHNGWYNKVFSAAYDPFMSVVEKNALRGRRQALLGKKEAMLTSFTESLMTYALGRRVESFDMPALRAIVRDAAKQDYRISALVQGVVRSQPFRMSKPQPSTATTNEVAAR